MSFNFLQLPLGTRAGLSLASAALLTTGLRLPAAEPVQELQDVVVTGQSLQSDQASALKSPTLILNVPQSLSIFTAEQIEAQGFDSMRDLVDYTPGVTTSQGEGHRDAIVFRGTRATADFYIDGIRDDVQYYRSLYNVEQVEILRGPNALLFGRGGTGGIINRVTKKGVPGTTFNDAAFAIDTFGAYSLTLDSNVSASDTSAIRVNASFESLDNHRDFFDGERIGVTPTLFFQLTEDTTLNVTYEYADHERFIDRGIPTGANGEPVEAFKDLVFGDSELNTTELEAHILRAGLEHRFSETLKLRLDAAYSDYDKLYQNFYSSSYDAVNTPDRVTLDGYVDTTRRENLILSADIVSEVETGPLLHKFVTGVETIHTTNDNDRYNSNFNTNPADPDVETFLIGNQVLTNGRGTSVNGPTVNDFTKDLNDRTSSDVTTYSAYLHDEISLNQQWILVAGARFDRFEIEADDLKNGVARSRTDNEVSPRFGLVYKPRENMSLYASYSETFLPRSGEQFATITDKTAALDPDVFENTEVGIKWDLKPGLSFTTSVFELEKSSPETGKDDAAALEIVKSSVTGFEAQLAGMLTDTWYISAGYSYLDGEVESDEDDDGNRPRELPEHLFSVWNRYQLSEKFGVGLGLIYHDETFIDNGNDTKLPSYVRVDAAVYYNLSDDLRLQLNVENLTDEVYFPNAHADHQATVGAPIHGRLALIGSF
jgi:catecholate siderophore receptor